MLGFLLPCSLPSSPYFPQSSMWWTQLQRPTIHTLLLSVSWYRDVLLFGKVSFTEQKIIRHRQTSLFRVPKCHTFGTQILVYQPGYRGAKCLLLIRTNPNQVPVRWRIRYRSESSAMRGENLPIWTLHSNSLDQQRQEARERADRYL